ncbi:MAG: DUF6602 domain-containing protein [Candidatus Bathyarchaeia archaeon]|jgi:hypothetical protein
MPQPFFQRLSDYYANIARVLQGEAEASSIFPNPTDVGSSREKIYAEVLRLHVPSSCNVLQGGFLFGQDGTESKQIDVLVTEGTSMQYKFLTRGESGKAFACVDGCLAVVSVKSTLNSAELEDSLFCFSSIPEKQPLTADRLPPLLTIKGYDDWPYKIIYASDGAKPETILDTLSHFYKEHPEIPLHKRPNLVHVIGKYAIIRILKGGMKTRDGTLLEPNSFHVNPDLHGVVGLIFALSEIQNTVAASKVIYYNYMKIINQLPL